MDKIVNAYKSAVVENYANFSGRLSVPGYWWFFLGNLIVAIFLQVLLQVSFFFILPALVYSFALFLPSLAAIVRRLHDTGKSGWFALLGLIPVVGTIILIVLLVGASQSGSNEYGPQPVS